MASELWLRKGMRPRKPYSLPYRECPPFRKAKAIHQRIVTIDSHTDTAPNDLPVNLISGEEEESESLWKKAYRRNLYGRLSRKVNEMRKLIQAATAYAIKRLNQVKRQQTLHPDRMVIATTPKRSDD